MEDLQKQFVIKIGGTFLGSHMLYILSHGITSWIMGISLREKFVRDDEISLLIAYVQKHPCLRIRPS